jgi:PKD repeat protein
MAPADGYYVAYYQAAPPPPLSASASANVTSGTAPLSVKFSGSASGGTAPYSYSWTFGDGGSSGQQTPSHAYLAPGTYNATLTVTDSQSNTATYSVTITVSQPQQTLSAFASASPTSGTAPLNVTFTGSASGRSPPYSYSWSFGDNSSSILQNPSHTYENAGSYSATLTVTDSANNTATSSVTITVETLANSFSVTFTELGLPSEAEWAVTINGSGVIDTTPSTSNQMIFYYIPNGIYNYSVTSPCFTASPASGSLNVTGADVAQLITFSVTYISTAWNTISNSYSEQWSNVGTYWSDRGNCYGFASTALLYFMHYTLGDTSYPYFPAQNAPESSTSDLNLSGFSNNELNNASLAITFHQVWGSCLQGVLAPEYPFDSEEQQRNYEYLIGNLTAEQPVLMTLGTGDAQSRDWPHTVVAWGVGEPQLNSDPFAVNIYLYDPDYPQTTQNATYNLATGNFSYLEYDKFMTTPAKDTLPDSSLNMFNYPSFAEPLSNGLKWDLYGYWFVVINCTSKMAWLETDNNQSADYFSEIGNSQKFVCGIPNSCGIEEGDCQFYAVPNGVNFGINDPGSNQSSMMIFCVDNASGQLVEYGYVLDASTTQGALNFTVMPLSSGLSISSGDNALNASVTCFSETQQSYSVSEAIDTLIGAMQTVNFTQLPASYVMTSIPSKMVVGQGFSADVNVTVENYGNSSEVFNVTFYANDTLIETLANVTFAANSITAIMFGWNTTGFDDGNYTIWAYASPSSGETDTANDTFTGGTVYVGIPGDINGDGRVNILDAILVSNAFLSTPGSPNWNPNADINSDGVVDILDAIILANNWTG